MKKIKFFSTIENVYLRVLLIVALLLSVSLFSVAQTKITGKILDKDSNDPVIGATLKVKGTVIGTITDINGDFKFSVPEGAEALLISSIGYEDSEVPIELTKTHYEIYLSEAILALDEVIVVAYGKTSKQAFTGSAAVVSSEDISKIKETSVANSLQGKATGVQITNLSSKPGAEPKITIRGISSVSFNTDPLIVLDGVPYEGGLNKINPNDIESFSVLKDANSTALYGSRASAGVIMITTKKGKSKDMQINFSSTFGYSDVAVPIREKISAEQTTELFWEMLYNGRIDRGYTDADARQYATENVRSWHFTGSFSPWVDPNNPGEYLLEPVGLDGKMVEGTSLVYDTDWADEFFQKGFRQDYNLDFSGTSKDNKVNYFISGSYLTDEGISVGQDFERLSGRVNVNAKLKDWLEIGTRTSYTHSFRDAPFEFTRYYYALPALYPIYTYDFENREYFTDQLGNKIPDTRIYADGSQWRHGWGYNTKCWGKYGNEKGKSFKGTFTNVFNSVNYLNLIFTKWLSLKSSIGYTNSNSENHSYSSQYWGFNNQVPSATRTYNVLETMTINNVLSANKSFDNHNINFLLGQEYYSLENTYLGGTREQFAYDNQFELGAASESTWLTSYNNNLRMSSYFSRLEYNYSDKYYLSGSYRTDGSSRFAQNNRWGAFWSVGGAWRLDQESFINSISLIDNLKLKASYGTTGNDKVGTYYAYQGLYTNSNELGSPAAYVTKLPASNLLWESMTQLSVGLDFGIWKRFSGSLEYFSKTAKDLLFNVQEPLSIGINSTLQNIGDNRNTGYEFMLNADVFNSSKFKWNVSFNITKIKNEVLKIPGGTDLFNGYHIIREGESMYTFYLHDYEGVNPTTGNNEWWMNIFETDIEGNIIYDEKGSPNVIDRELTDDVTDISGNDHKIIAGKSLPDYFGSVSTGFSAYGFDLSVMFYFSIGSQMMDYAVAEYTHQRYVGYPLFEETLDRWTPENTDGTIARLSDYQTNIRYDQASTKWIFDNDYLRLRNLTIGYTLPDKLIDKIKFKKARIYFTGNNLLTWGEAAKRNLDPEINPASGVYYNGPAGDGSVTSALKMYSLGLQISF